MTWELRPLPSPLGPNGEAGAHQADPRPERCETAVRAVEYRPFPRASRGQRKRLGFARDVSASGLCLESEAGEPPGRLLHVVVHGIDGRPAFAGVARVAGCERAGDSHRLGLSLLARRDSLGGPPWL
jgi:hypothetical protein